MFGIVFIQSRGSVSRTGVTILEVLFAIGIVIVGLLGIASILPLAGRQAADSNRAAESQALAENWYREFKIRGMYQTGNWVHFQDFAPPGYITFSKSYSTPTNSSGPQTIPINWRPPGKQSICIDPVFYTDRDVRKLIAAGAFLQPNTSQAWYRPSVFPYFQDKYNPTVDPFYTIAGTSGSAWDDQPRMLRVTLGSPTALINAKMVEHIFTSQDELVIAADEGDRSLPPVRGIQFYTDPTSISGYFPYARAQNKGNYSWMATLSPVEQMDSSLESHYTLSLIVFQRRDTLFYDPTSFSARTPDSESSPEDRPAGERLAWVVPMSGNFDGGHGGRVRLIATDGVDDGVHLGDWIMLSRYMGAMLLSPQEQRRFSIFRWYRIVGVDSDTTHTSLTNALAGTGLTADPFGFTPPANNTTAGGTDEVWFRDVVLEGPDWNFTPAAPGIAVAPTTATLVKGAAHVIERIVEIP